MPGIFCKSVICRLRLGSTEIALQRSEFVILTEGMELRGQVRSQMEFGNEGKAGGLASCREASFALRLLDPPRRALRSLLDREILRGSTGGVARCGLNHRLMNFHPSGMKTGAFASHSAINFSSGKVGTFAHATTQNMLSSIDRTFLKVANDICVAVNQGGKRPGALPDLHWLPLG